MVARSYLVARCLLNQRAMKPISMLCVVLLAACATEVTEFRRAAYADVARVLGLA